LFIVFFHFFIITLLHSTVYYSFTKGKNLKAKILLNETELIKERDILNIAFPFFLSNDDNYNLSKRVYPDPFPLNNLIGENLYNKKSQYPYSYEVNISKPYLQLDNVYYQFGEVKYETINCEEKAFIDTIYDTPKTYGLKRYSIYNFSNVFISDYSFLPKDYHYKKNIAPYVHQVLLEKNITALKNILDSVRQVCKKYGIKHHININDLAAVALKDSLIDVTIATNERDGDGNNIELSTSGNSVDLNYYYGINSKNYLDKGGIENIYENYEDALHNSPNHSPIFWSIFFFSLITAYFLLLGKFATGPNILLSAVIAGVLSIGFALISFLFVNTWDNQEGLPIVATVYCGIVILLGYLSINSTSILKWIRDKLALITYVSLPAFFCLLWSNFYPEGYSVPGKGCQQNEYIAPSFTAEPWHYALVGLLSIIPAFLLIRKWTAKPE
jgi:hypothetical protein